MLIYASKCKIRKKNNKLIDFALMFLIIADTRCVANIAFNENVKKTIQQNK